MSDSSRTQTTGDDQDSQERSSRGGLPDPEEMSQEEIEEIEDERRRRLDPANRPENAVVDNTDKEFDFERGELVDKSELEERNRDRTQQQDSGDEDGSRSGQGPLPDPEEMSQEEIEEIEDERRRRLDPANRPENAEVDNTDKELDSESGELVESRAEDG